MKIIVCLKQVPARDAVLRINPAGTWVVSADVSFEINEPDIYALEEGLRLKEKHGGEVVVASLGPARAQQASGRATPDENDEGCVCAGYHADRAGAVVQSTRALRPESSWVTAVSLSRRPGERPRDGA